MIYINKYMFLFVSLSIYSYIYISYIHMYVYIYIYIQVLLAVRCVIVDREFVYTLFMDVYICDLLPDESRICYFKMHLNGSAARGGPRNWKLCKVFLCVGLISFFGCAGKYQGNAEGSIARAI